MSMDIATLGIRVDSTDVRGAAGDLDRLGGAAGRTSTSISATERAAKLLGSAFALIGAAALARDMLKTIEQVQNLEIRLTGLTKGAKDYADTQKYLSDVSRQHHKDNLQLQESFAGLLAIEQTGVIARKQSKLILEGMSNAQSKTGATSDALKQSTLGLSQALSMGTLQWEEMKQVTEPLPGLLSKIAEAAGYTGKSAIGDFKNVVSAGQVTSDMFGRIMVSALNSYQGAADNAGQTLTAQYADVKNSWEDLAKAVEEPVADAITPLLKFLTWQIGEFAKQANYLKSLFNELWHGGVTGGAPDNGMDTGRPKPPEIVVQDTAAAAIRAEIEATAKSTGGKKAHKEAMSDEQKAANALQSSYESLAGSLAKENALAGNNSKLAALEYDVTSGALKDLTETKKLYLLQQQSEISNRELLTKSNEASKTAMQTEIDKYNELTMSAHDFFVEKLKAAGVNEADIPAISAKHDVNTGIEAAKSKNDDLQKSLESYGKTLDDANLKTKELGLTNSAIFDGALGGVNTLTGAFSNMVKAIQENVTALDELQKKKLENDNFQPDASKGFTDDYIKQVKLKATNVQKYAAEEKKLNNDNFKASLTGVRQIASATGQMFAENTTARKVFNAVSLAASVAERLSDLAGLAVKGAGAMLTQGQGDPYSAFARIAAMGAIVMSIIASVGGAFSGGGGGAATAPPPPTSPDTGTVLGDSTAKSQSINNTYQLLKDIHASEYAELRGINAGVAALSSGITSVITRLFQAGGITDAKVNLNATLGGIAGMFKAGFGGMNLDPIMGWLLGGIFGGATKQEITGGGIATGSASLESIRKGGNLSASQYTTVKKTVDGGWFGDDKVSYYNMYQAIDSATQKALNSVFKSMGDTMFNLAKSLGGNLTQKVNDYIIPAMTVELRGLSGKDAADKLNGVLSAALDTMSMAVFGPMLSQYQQLGEGMLETTTRIVAEMAIVKDALGMSGLTLTQNIIAVSDAIVQATGGLKEFQAAFESYFDKFYSDSEKTARTYGQMSGALSDVGLTVAATRAGYRAQIEALNMNNALDQQRYSLLISLSTAADTYYSSLEKISDAMKLMTESNFKTAVDYTRYLSLASLSGVKEASTLLRWDNQTFMPTGQAAVAQLPTLSTPAGTTGSVTEAITNMSNSNTNVAAEIKLLRDQQAAQALAIAQNTQETAKLLKRWDGDGMPAVRTTV